MTRRVRILHIINNLAIGGAELMLIRLAKSLRPEFDQEVLCILDEGSLAVQLREAGIPVVALDQPPRMPSPLILQRLAAIIRRSAPDIVQTWLYQSDLLGGLAARLAGVGGVVWNIRAADLPDRGLPLLTRLTVRLCAALSHRVPSSIVVCAESAAELHAHLGYDRRRITLIHNGVDTKLFEPSSLTGLQTRRQLGIAETDLVIGQFGRLHPQKDHSTFFAAASRLREVHPNVQLVLAGEGMDADARPVREWLRQYGLREGVHLLGARKDVHRLYPALDLATSSSAWGEGFPNVLAEAMACGVPCVATDCGDAALILGDTGRVVPSREPALLAAAMDEFVSMSPEDRRMRGDRARARVVERFSMEACSASYAALYRSLASTVHLG